MYKELILADFPIYSPEAIELTEVEVTHFVNVVINEAMIAEKVCAKLIAEINGRLDYKSLLSAILKVVNGLEDETFSAHTITKNKLINDVEKFQRDAAKSNAAYDKHSKPNPEAIFWPDKETFSKGEVLPFVKRYPIMNRQTIIGAAGSCFANEFSYAMQHNQFNYMIAEPLANGEGGVLNDAISIETKYADASAQWGILFNTPSFKQLAERAFRERSFPKLLTKQVNTHGLTLYSDPYREGIYFQNPEAYEANYQQHLDAVRNVLSNCEVFVITPGLNECWEYLEDGSILSRNPRDEFLRSLCRPKVLTLEENVESLQAFIDIIRRYNPEVKVIISLSPVPFLATTRADEMHVVEANCLSKSCLRLAVDHVVRANSETYYFPSYEYVTGCVDNAWEDDRRHIRRETVANIMSLFEATFVQ